MKKAITIIEMIIALIIFWVWIIVILITLNKNIIISKKIQLKTQATILAKEWMEIVFNKRDSNNIKYLNWNYITWNLTDNFPWNDVYFKWWDAYKVWTSFSWYENYVEKIFSPYVLNSKLYIKTWQILNSVGEIVYSWFYYNYKTWDNTPFSRYIIFTWIYLDPEKDSLNKDIIKINSIVKYNWWYISWNVVLESFISNWK